MSANVPTVTIEARYSKHRRQDRIVLSRALADELTKRRAELGAVKDSDRVIHVPKDVAKRLHADLGYAKIEPKDAAGRAARLPFSQAYDGNPSEPWKSLTMGRAGAFTPF
ncbi:MAG: hypothetical protein Kow0099_21350 [Candidatus Abyssubacteria bacterium]